tara:strand:+ start:1850 stop:2650 length:801 start_codon:yes stop_codon:yes gene_type:complete
MKRLLTTQDGPYLQQLYAWLRSQGIPVSVSERNGKLDLLLHQSSYEARAHQLIDEFKANPDIVAVREEGKSRQLFADLMKNTGWLTRVIAAICALVFVGVMLGGDTFVRYFIISDSFTELPLNTPWRLLTPAFLHFSATHIVFNLFWWWYLGGRIEVYLGTRWLLALFVLTAISANVIQFYVSGPNFGGMSGVVYGLLGFCWLYSGQRNTPLKLPPALIIFMLGWLILGYTDVLWVNVANEAHLAGLIAGCIAGITVRQLKPQPRY